MSDPVDPTVLSQLETLDRVRVDLGSQLLDLEQEKVGILAAAHHVEQQRQRLFDNVLIERGLDPKTLVHVDSKTGIISLKEGEIAGSIK